MATRAIVLLLIVQLALVFAARRNNDPLMEGIYQARRTANGMMGGYAGISKRGPPMAIAGGFATHLSPSYASASDEEQQEEEEEPVMMDEEEMEEEPKLDEESEEKIKPVRPAKRPSRKRPQRPRQEEEDEDDEGGMMGGGGVTAIATSYSSGKGASSKSHAIAYGGGYKGGRFSR